MSNMQYISAKAHVVLDSESARNLAKKVMAVFGCSNWDVEYQDVSDEDGEGYTDVVVKVGGYDSAPSESIDEVLGEVATLGNGSYGLMIWESDWGIDAFDCYGDVELVDSVSVDEDTVWSSEDTLTLRIRMTGQEWAALLGVEPKPVKVEVEGRGGDPSYLMVPSDDFLAACEDASGEILARALPSAFIEACEDDGEAEFAYYDVDCSEADGEIEQIDVIFELCGHDLRHGTFLKLVAALGEKSSNASTLLCLESSMGAENRMVDSDSFSMLTFVSDWDSISDVRVLVPRAI